MNMYILTLLIFHQLFGGSIVNARWFMTQLSANDRARACEVQVSACYNTCGSVPETTKNFCNIQTMGWNCVCNSKSRQRTLENHEWPVVVSECRAALAACNTGCTTVKDGRKRADCYTNCTTDYQCNTAEAPISNLRVSNVDDLPVGYTPPNDTKIIDLNIGMKFGNDADDGRPSSKRAMDDPTSLPKRPPSTDDDRDSIEGNNNGKDANNNRNKKDGTRENERAIMDSSSAESITKTHKLYYERIFVCGIFFVFVSGIATA